MKKFVHINTILGMVLSAVVSLASADEYDQAMTAFDQGDYATAHELLLPLAKYHGYANAMNTLGIMYENGMGVDVNGDEAATWYKKAALEGNIEAMYNLGVLYFKGVGIAKNPAVALGLITTAFTFFLVQFATMRLPASKVMAYTYVTPAWVIIWDRVVGHPWPTFWVMAGVAICCVALILLLKE